MNHIAGAVAPVNKTVIYGTVTNIPGEQSKCWITRNLGASQQATAVNDNTEASAGWYWQFNLKQGYKHDGTNRTPNTTWITNINDNLDWQQMNDPCSIELGNPWRIPTFTEWSNVRYYGAWLTWNDPWASGLKLHTAGSLFANDGSLYKRGYEGFYWTSMQSNSTRAFFFDFGSGFNCAILGYYKSYGFTLRCLRE